VAHTQIRLRIVDLQTRVLARLRSGAALDAWRRAWLRNVRIRGDAAAADAHRRRWLVRAAFGTLAIRLF
jgi:hypothetical protein